MGGEAAQDALPLAGVDLALGLAATAFPVAIGEGEMGAGAFGLEGDIDSSGKIGGPAGVDGEDQAEGRLPDQHATPVSLVAVRVDAVDTLLAVLEDADEVGSF